MAGHSNFCGIILAAGESSRMGRDKALLPYPRQSPTSGPAETFLSGHIRLFREHADAVTVVAGKNRDSISPVAAAFGASVTVNPAPERGQFSSLQTGLREALNRGFDSVLITLVDRPPIRTETLATLKQSFEAAITDGKWAVIPQHHDHHGHPILAGRGLIEAFLRAPDVSNAREVEHAHQDAIVYIAVDDPFVSLNVDTPEQYAALSSPPFSPVL